MGLGVPQRQDDETQCCAHSAEALYEALPPNQRGLLRTLLLRLVAVTADGEPVRTRMPRRLVAIDATTNNSSNDWSPPGWSPPMRPPSSGPTNRWHGPGRGCVASDA